MKHRNVTWSTLLVLLLLVWAAWQTRQRKPPAEPVWRNPGVLRFTPEALCQVKCLGWQQSDAATILRKGLVLYHRSNRRANPCPVWELQGTIAAGSTGRIRVEQCNGYSVVVQAGIPGRGNTCNCAPSGGSNQGPERIKK